VRFFKKEQRKRPGNREDVILFAVGPYTFAIGAKSVEKIENMEELRPIKLNAALPRLAKVKHTLERERQYFVVDASTHLLMLPSRASRVLMLRNSSVALAVDSIDRIAEISAIHPLPHSFIGEERGWYRGVALIQDAVVPVVNAEAFLTTSDLKQMQAALSKSAQSSKQAAGAVSA
jgi:chemotaxis signal transduction protein